MVNFAHSSTWVRIAKLASHYCAPLEKESRTNKRSIKGDRLQLADPANFIHGELSRVDRQWTPLRLIVRKGRRRIETGEREKDNRIPRMALHEKNFYNFHFEVITYCPAIARKLSTLDTYVLFHDRSVVYNTKGYKCLPAFGYFD